MLRQYLSRRTVKEVRKANLLGLIAAGSGADSKEWLGKVDSVLNKYINSLLGIDAYEEDFELGLREEYEKIRHQKPRMYLSSDGQAIVEGID